MINFCSKNGETSIDFQIIKPAFCFNTTSKKVLPRYLMIVTGPERNLL